ncbi:MAG: hypothetical protein V2J89_02765 [Halieaceae bacterium]|jgi:hypothetical protein|nr:hypothetical protein [Halieaceae bacterium]
MNWDALSAIGEIVGATGVIVTLVYLAIQIRQNTRASRVNAVQESMENSARFSELLATNSDLLSLFTRGLVNPEELNADERRTFVSILNVFMRREAVAFYLYRNGTMPKELWDARVAIFRGTLNQPGLKVYLAFSAETLPGEFRTFVEDVAAGASTLSEGAREFLTRRDP